MPVLRATKHPTMHLDRRSAAQLGQPQRADKPQAKRERGGGERGGGPHQEGAAPSF